MENIPARNMNPPEMPEDPRCPSCDVPMVDKRKIGMPENWVCENLMCEDCSIADDLLVKELREYADYLAMEVCKANSRTNQIRTLLSETLIMIDFHGTPILKEHALRLKGIKP